MANTQSKEVNLTKRVQTSKGLRYCTVALSANGRVKPDLVIVNGQQERHSEGAYHLEWQTGASVGWEGCGRRQVRDASEKKLNSMPTNKVNEIFA